jgi:hypothetical protein
MEIEYVSSFSLQSYTYIHSPTSLAVVIIEFHFRWRPHFVCVAAGLSFVTYSEGKYREHMMQRRKMAEEKLRQEYGI